MIRKLAPREWEVIWLESLLDDELLRRWYFNWPWRGENIIIFGISSWKCQNRFLHFELKRLLSNLIFDRERSRCDFNYRILPPFKRDKKLISSFKIFFILFMQSKHIFASPLFVCTSVWDLCTAKPVNLGCWNFTCSLTSLVRGLKVVWRWPPWPLRLLEVIQL